ncbi:hypothetical protein RQP46_002965 [Phenoliferia psychrophenolica]
MSPTPRVAFLGPLGTYSHQVTSDFFGQVELVPVPKIIDVFTAVETGSVQYGLVPIENSSIGPVLETVDALRTTHLCVRSMRALKIGHAIMGQEGLTSERVKRVYSHEQGIGQCVHYLKRNYPDAEVLPCNSTARAAELARDDGEALAICSIKCAEVYGLTVLDTNIQDGGAKFLKPSLTRRSLDVSALAIALAGFAAR